MKTTAKIIIGLLLLAFVSTTNVNAGNDQSPKFGKILKKYITYPDFAKQQNLEGVVVVCFTLDTNGKIQIKTTSESDVTLKDYVVSKINNLKMLISNKDTEANNKEECYYVKIVFKLV